MIEMTLTQMRNVSGQQLALMRFERPVTRTVMAGRISRGILDGLSNHSARVKDIMGDLYRSGGLGGFTTKQKGYFQPG